MAAVTLSAVRKSFGSTPVVHGVDVSIADGEFCVLVGPSGCGKSTLLRMIAGLEEISGGEVRIGGRVVNNVAPKQRDIAMVFQNYALYPHMTVYDNMAFSLKLAGLPAEEVKRRAHEAANILGLMDYLGRYPRQLSGGQRQRVAMGRAIVRKPQVFLFDEPLSNLDAKLRGTMRLEMKKLHQQLGVTTVFVTHDQIEAMTLADRVVVMNGGHIEQVGTPDDVYHAPASLFVAEFIGAPTMNLVPAERSGPNQLRLSESGQVIVLPKPIAGSGSALMLGMRREDADVAQGAIAPGQVDMRAGVEVVEPLGADTLVFTRMSGH